jgi:chromosomal replication initiation ATPase DnaA
MSQRTDPAPGAQLPLDLRHVPALDADDFLISGSNAAAMALVEIWPAWSGRAALIAGPAGSGKSHLVNVWRKRCGARVLSAGALSETLIAGHDGQPLAVEDLDTQSIDERALFHLMNLSRERGFDILFTARTLPGCWTIALPDLRSRLRALPIAQIMAPDDALLRGVLIKLFDDRQLFASPAVIDFMVLRMERSIAAAAAIVERMDKVALAEKRRISRNFAARFLSDTAQ